MIAMVEERRIRRSVWPSEALRHQLGRTAARHRIDLMVLADAEGAVWASSSRRSPPGRCTALAAQASKAAYEDDTGEVAILADEPDVVLVQRIAIGPTVLHLISKARGRAARRSREALAEAGRGVRRILGQL